MTRHAVRKLAPFTHANPAQAGWQTLTVPVLLARMTPLAASLLAVNTTAAPGGFLMRQKYPSQVCQMKSVVSNNAICTLATRQAS